MIDRVKTGIPGLDEMLNGGIPKRNIVLVSGGPGTGKTIFSQQYLYHGLTLEEPGILITLEEHPVQVRRNMAEFGWNVKDYEEKGLFAIVDAFTGGIGESAKREKYVVRSVDEIGEFLDTVKNALRDTKAQRAVIDSVSTLYLTKPVTARNILMQLKRMLSGFGVTAILVSQVSVTERGFGGPGVEHCVDGIIRLDLDEVEGGLIRSIIIWKMRGTKHDMRRHPFEINDKGISIDTEKIVKSISRLSVYGGVEQ
ncbi:MAG: KaiC domain-containing protein [Thermoproteota archaeon]|nr:KaiC domain-containing protein [Candidatus Brockarchaeota archaeon]